MNAKHTLGPWMSDHRDIYASNESGEVYVAVAHFNFLPEVCEANARLISAAPDLLEACELAVNMIDDLQLDVSSIDYNVLLQAIRKAKGE